MRIAAALSVLSLMAAVLAASPARAADPAPTPLPDFIKVPPGFAIAEYARVPKARTLVPVPDLGLVFVGQRGPEVHAILDTNQDGRPEKVVRLFDDLNVANGIDWKDGWLYIAEQDRIRRWREGGGRCVRWRCAAGRSWTSCSCSRPCAPRRCPCTRRTLTLTLTLTHTLTLTLNLTS